MNEEHIVRRQLGDKQVGKTDWARLEVMTEEEIEAAALSDPDNLPMDVDSPEFWQRGAMLHYPRRIARLNIDPDLLGWFQRQSEDYRVQMGDALRAYMESHEHTEPPSRKPAPDNPVEEDQQKTPSQPSRAVE